MSQIVEYIVKNIMIGGEKMKKLTPVVFLLLFLFTTISYASYKHPFDASAQGGSIVPNYYIDCYCKEILIPDIDGVVTMHCECCDKYDPYGNYITTECSTCSWASCSY